MMNTLRDHEWLEAREPPGTWAHELSPMPAMALLRYLDKHVSYVSRERKKLGGATVFRLHAGIQQTLLTDWESVRFFARAPDSLMARPNRRCFGPVRFREDLMGHSHIAVLSSGARHLGARGLFADLFAMRQPAFEPAVTSALNDWTSRWRRAGEFELLTSLGDCVNDALWRWLFDVPPPEGQGAFDWFGGMSSLWSDRPLANRILARMSAGCPAHVPEWTREQISRISSSPHYDDIVELARKHQVPERELPGMLFTTALFNGTGGTVRTLLPTVCAISNSPRVFSKLRQELNAFDGSLASLAGLPYLDAVITESNRMWTRPVFQSRIAQRDFVLPAKGGNRYRIRTGDLLTAVFWVAYRDPDIFPTPDVFYPQRYLDDPSMTAKVFRLGWAPEQQNNYGCIAQAHGQALTLTSCVLAYLFGEHDFRLVPKPELSNDALSWSVIPNDVKVQAFRRKPEKTVGELQ